jgi:hypothetical protein
VASSTCELAPGSQSSSMYLHHEDNTSANWTNGSITMSDHWQDRYTVLLMGHVGVIY